MTPIEFVLFDGDSEPNRPVHEVADAMRTALRIVGPDLTEYEVYSYYYDSGQMVLELKESE